MLRVQYQHSQCTFADVDVLKVACTDSDHGTNTVYSNSMRPRPARLAMPIQVRCTGTVAKAMLYTAYERGAAKHGKCRGRMSWFVTMTKGWGAPLRRRAHWL